MKAKKWQLQEAKNRLSELVDQALESGPQVITRRGRDAVVVLACEKYELLARRSGSLIDLLRKAPKVRGGLSPRRDADSGRKVDLS
jgi:prevent-host-death family protein